MMRPNVIRIADDPLNTIKRRPRLSEVKDSEVLWLVAEVERLCALLRRIEWAAGDDFGAACPECQGYRDYSDGHLPDCELAAALRGRR